MLCACCTFNLLFWSLRKVRRMSDICPPLRRRRHFLIYNFLAIWNYHWVAYYLMTQSYNFTTKLTFISDSLRARNPQIMANGQILTAQDMIEEEQHHQQQYQQQHQQVGNHWWNFTSLPSCVGLCVCVPKLSCLTLTILVCLVATTIKIEAVSLQANSFFQKS